MQKNDRTRSVIELLVPHLDAHMQRANQKERTRLLTGLLKQCDPQFVCGLNLAYGVAPLFDPSEKQDQSPFPVAPPLQEVSEKASQKMMRQFLQAEEEAEIKGSSEGVRVTEQSIAGIEAFMDNEGL